MFQGLHTKTEGAKPKVFKDGQYSDPMYKKLSKINGEINKLTKQELQARLREYGLDTRYRVSQMLRVVHVAYSELPNYCFALKLLFYIIYIYIVLFDIWTGFLKNHGKTTCMAFWPILSQRKYYE